MNNRSLSPSQKPLFSPSYISELSICHIAHILFLFSPPYLYNCFLLDFSIFPSSHMLLAQSQLSVLSQSDVLGHTSGIPWQGSPLPSLHHHPQHFFFNGADWIEIFRWPSFVPPEKTKLMQDQNNEGRSVFHLIWAGVPHGPAHGPLSTKLHHSIYQLSINQQ